MVKKHYSLIFSLILLGSTSVFGMQNNNNELSGLGYDFDIDFNLDDKPLLAPVRGNDVSVIARDNDVSRIQKDEAPLDPTYPKNGTIEQKKHWLSTYYKLNNIKPRSEDSKKVEALKKTGSSLLTPVKWVMNSRSPLARYTRYGLAAVALGTVLFFPEQAVKILLKDNIYNSVYQGIRYGFADMVGSAVKAPFLKNIGLSVAYTCLGYQGIKNAASAGRSVVAGVKNNYTQAKNWCLSWVREPR